MRYNISRIIGTIIAFPIAVIAWFISIFAFDIYMFFDLLISAATFFVVYFPTQRLTSRRYLIEIGYISIVIFLYIVLNLFQE